MTIPGIPDSIPRARFVELIEGLGLDAKQLIKLEFKRDGIYAEMFALNEAGERFTVDDQTMATHHICIPVTDVEVTQ